MGQVNEKWLSLFNTAATTRVVASSLAEAGYYLFVIPNFSDMSTWQELRVEGEYKKFLTRLGHLEEGVSVTLNDQQSFHFGAGYDYHLWAQRFANKIDSREIIAHAVIDPAIYLKNLDQLAKDQGFVMYSDPTDGKHLEIICQRFRQPVNLYREIGRMVFSAKLMEEEIQDFLYQTLHSCSLLHGYAQKFFRIFSNYRTFVGDHHFVAARGEKELAPGFDYWSLLANPEQMEETFWRGVDAVKQFLKFAESEKKDVH